MGREGFSSARRSLEPSKGTRGLICGGSCRQMGWNRISRSHSVRSRYAPLARSPLALLIAMLRKRRMRAQMPRRNSCLGTCTPRVFNRSRRTKQR